jgi:uncharacterized membrane protein YjjP (DUF1212 family)
MAGTVADQFAETPSAAGATARAEAIGIVAQAASLLLEDGQTTERTICVTERLGHVLGVPVRVLPHWGEVAIHVEGATVSDIVPAVPLGVHMGRVLAAMNVIDQVCGGTLPVAEAGPALAAAKQTPPASMTRFALLAAIGAVAMAVIFGAQDVATLVVIAFSAGLGALLRRFLAKGFANPFAQPLCAAFVAGLLGAAAGRLPISDAQGLAALCPCMMLIPGPHILNGAIDLARTRIALGIARLAYAGLIVLMICTGLLLGLAIGGAPLPAAVPPLPVPIAADVVAAGCAVAAFGTFFSMPWRLLPASIAVGMLAHAVRWALIALAGAHVAVGALVACLLVGTVMTIVADRLRLPFAALSFSAIVSLMPGLLLFRAASALAGFASLGDGAPALLQSAVADGLTAFLVIFAMSFGLILPRLLLEGVHRK